MHCCRINILRKIFITSTSTLRANTTTSLFFKISQWSTFDISKVAYCNNDRIIRVEILCIKLMLIWYNLCTTVIAIFFLNFLQFSFHHLLTTLRVIKNLLQVLNGLHKFFKLLMQLVKT